jgi:hypothetical protein
VAQSWQSCLQPLVNGCRGDVDPATASVGRHPPDKQSDRNKTQADPLRQSRAYWRRSSFSGDIRARVLLIAEARIDEP